MQDQVESLKALGSTVTDYKQSNPTADMLEVFPNAYPDRPYTVHHRTKEFTSLCPKTGQPDSATIEIEIVPALLCVETKSLKLYLFAYRSEQSFMETITNRILTDLVTACKPRQCKVIAKFRPRGGIQTEVTAEA